MLTKLKKD